MANFATTADILEVALRQAGEVYREATPLYSKALEYLNYSYRLVLAGPSEFDLDFNEPFSWAREETPAILTLKGAYEVGTVALSNGSSTATLSAIPADSLSLKDYHLKVDGRPEYYRVMAHTAGTDELTLDAPFIGVDSPTAKYKAVKLIYDLGSNILRLCEGFRVYRNNSGDQDFTVNYLPLNQFRRDWPISKLQQRVPVTFTVLTENDDEFLVQFSSFVDEDTRVEIDYVKKPAPLTVDPVTSPIIPLKDRMVLAYLVAAQILFNEKKQDAAGSVQWNFAKNKLRSMIEGDAKRSSLGNKYYGRLIPRRDQVNRLGRYRGL